MLGWTEWRKVGTRYGLGLVMVALQTAMDAGILARQPVRPLAHLLLAAMTEACLIVASASDQAAARAEVEGPLVALLEGLRA